MLVTRTFFISPNVFYLFIDNLHINSLPNNKILNVTRLKAFADDKFSVAKVMISLFDKIQNIVRKGENAGYQHFLLSHNVYNRLLLQGP